MLSQLGQYSSSLDNILQTQTMLSQRGQCSPSSDNIPPAWTTSSKHRQCAPNTSMFVPIRPIQSPGQVSPDDCVYMASMRFQTWVVIPCLGYRQPRPLPASPHGSHRMGELQVPGNIGSQMKIHGNTNELNIRS